jgi:hypothetical protein
MKRSQKQLLACGAIAVVGILVYRQYQKKKESENNYASFLGIESHGSGGTKPFGIGSHGNGGTKPFGIGRDHIYPIRPGAPKGKQRFKTGVVTTGAGGYGWG